MVDRDKNTITAETVKQMAEVAGLEVDADRAAQLASALQSLRRELDSLGKLDLTDVEPALVFPSSKE